MHRCEPSAEQSDTDATLYPDDLWGTAMGFGDAEALDEPPEVPPPAHPSADPRRRREVRGLRKKIEEYLERRRLEEALQEKLEDNIFCD